MPVWMMVLWSTVTLLGALVITRKSPVAPCALLMSSNTLLTMRKFTEGCEVWV